MSHPELLFTVFICLSESSKTICTSPAVVKTLFRLTLHQLEIIDLGFKSTLWYADRLVALTLP